MIGGDGGEGVAPRRRRPMEDIMIPLVLVFVYLGYTFIFWMRACKPGEAGRDPTARDR
jgi:hypothetical protein